jgi:hypothetical protein
MYSINDILNAFKTYWKFLLISPIIFCFLAFAYLYFVPAQYTIQGALQLPKFRLIVSDNSWGILPNEDPQLSQYWNSFIENSLKRKVLVISKKLNIDTSKRTNDFEVIKIDQNKITFCITAKNQKDSMLVAKKILETLKNLNPKLCMESSILSEATKARKDFLVTLFKQIINERKNLKKELEYAKIEAETADDIISQIININNKMTSKKIDSETLKFYITSDLYQKKYEIILNNLRIKSELAELDEKLKRHNHFLRELNKTISKINYANRIVKKIEDESDTTISNVNDINLAAETIKTAVEQVYKSALPNMNLYFKELDEKLIESLVEPNLNSFSFGKQKPNSKRLDLVTIILSSLICGLTFSSLLIIIIFTSIKPDLK